MTLTFYELMCLMGGLAVYLTIVCIFFYRLNEKNIEKLDERMNKFDERMDKSETHWREMFMYFNSQLNESKKDRRR